MIWQVVIEYSARAKGYTEIIWVWDIVQHDFVSRLISYLNDRLRNSVIDRRQYKPVGDMHTTARCAAVALFMIPFMIS